MSCLPALALIALCCASDPPPPINPFPRTTLPEVSLARWEFDRGADGWAAEHGCVLSAEEGLLKIRATGDDPYLHRPLQLPGGEGKRGQPPFVQSTLRAVPANGDCPLFPEGHFVFKMKARGRTSGPGEIFWTTDRSPARGPDKSRQFGLIHDNRWHEYTVAFSAPGTLTDLRLDPGAAAGQFEIDWIELARRGLHPLSIERVETGPDRARFFVKNHEAELCEFTARGKPYSVPGQGTVAVEYTVSGKKPVSEVTLEIQVKGKDLPPVRRTAFVYRPEPTGDRVVRPLGECSLEIARDGSMAWVRREGRLLAVLAPLVHCDGKVPALKLVQEKPALRWEGKGVALSLSVSGKEIEVSIASDRRCEGPVVRVLGELQGGLFAGLEYLGKGEYSSSMLDIETEEHLRFAPDPLKVTMPLVAFATDRATVVVQWNDMSLQPTYATPNFLDGTPDHRMSLQSGKKGTGSEPMRENRGKSASGEVPVPVFSQPRSGQKIDATILVDRLPLEETIAWAVKRRGLPPLPPAPRSEKEQWEICTKALNGPLRTEAGWGHCAEPNWGRAPHADMASTIWRLTGQVVPLDRVVPGGAHVANDSYYFVTGRAAEWQAIQAGRVKGLLRQQRPDGSFRYDGPFRRGHFEDTAVGVCARPAQGLLDYARLTGDKTALEAGLRALDYMTAKRFDVPRGAQVWEIPLHTPDQLASAYAVWAYVRGYELTGKKQYLAEARRWALSGIPFVYLWSRYPVMLYGTPPVFGATNWKAPNWMGLPVQWVGGVYAYALGLLAPHDQSLDWNHLARGILISAEQQQYPNGEWIGLLPDSFVLGTQQRNPARINPCALVSLRLVLDGQVDSLAVAFDGKHRVVAPFPITLRDGKAHLEGRKGLDYQVLVDGNVVNVKSQGDDGVPLGE